MKHNLKPQKNIIKRPTLDLLLHLPKTKLQKFEVIVDTGYSGNLCIDEKLVKLLNLEYMGKVKQLNIDSQKSLDKLYKLKIEFPSLELNHTKFIVAATAKENMPVEMLMGQELLNLFANANNLALVINYPKNEIYFSKEEDLAKPRKVFTSERMEFIERIHKENNLPKIEPLTDQATGYLVSKLDEGEEIPEFHEENARPFEY